MRRKLALFETEKNLQYPFAFVINIKLLCEQYVHEVVILISEVLKGHSPKDSKA